ncbi:MAG: UDP-N-acetylmuramyl-tripeptide synthetase [Candidatus Falkowbacteria bacterium]
MDKILNIIKKYIPKKLFKYFQPAYHFLLSWFSAVWHKRPGEKLIVIGVTGTTGKTTIVYLIAEVLKSSGYKVGYTSTAMFSDGEKEWLNDKKMTMVGRFFTQRMLRDMARNKCQYAIVETTSEGIVQYRHKFINYDILIFTGLYPEHIDSHGGFENYKQAKGKLFAHLKDCKTKYVNEEKYVCKAASGIKKLDLNRVKKAIIANGDDEHVSYFLGFSAEEKIKYEVSAKDGPSFGWRSMEPKVMNKESKDDAAIKKLIALDIDVSGDGASFVVNDTRINLRLLGEFNVSNAMAAVGTGLSQGLDMAEIKNGLEKVKGVPGRFERINEGQNFTVIVDYAFEPNAVEKLYETIKLISHSKIIHVLGSAGGGRDINRRPKLGKIAGEKADYAIITNEDPYDEDPQIIIDQVAAGAEKAGKELGKNLFKILDRREAIKKAFSLAREKDIVLITGKGSEQAICVEDGKKITWDDRQVAREELGK